MESALSKSISRCRMIKASANATPRSSVLGSNLSEYRGILGGRFDSNVHHRYVEFRGWVHAAINAIAQEAANQPIRVGRVSDKRGPTKRTKVATVDAEMDLTHPILKSLECPNNIQGKWQFVYSFIANLNLTGWSFVVSDEVDGKVEFYSLPTSWITPVHRKGAFAEFVVSDPRNPSGRERSEPIDGSRVAFAYMPDPSDPLTALPLTVAQGLSIAVDNNIQLTQKKFFDNGIFPSVVITMGADPHPDVPGGVRPRLTAEQRRQVYAAIKKVSSGIANYGNPAIIDGMIEKIERMSATQNEIGWEKSEKTVRSRILSAFGVHPFILGDEMVGSYAQAYIVESRFHRKVNTNIGMFNGVMTKIVNSVGAAVSSKSGSAIGEVKVWLEDCKTVDPSMDRSMWEAARNRDDISQNEFRHYMGLPPDEDTKESVISKQSIQPISAIAAQVVAGSINYDQALAILEGIGLPTEVASKIAGSGKIKPKPQDPMAAAPEPAKPESPESGAGKLKTKPKPESPESDTNSAEKAASSLSYLDSIVDYVLLEDPL